MVKRLIHSNSSRHFEMPLTPDKIKGVVLSYFDMSERRLFSDSRKQDVVFARFVFIHCLWHYTRMRQEDIAKVAKIDRTSISRAVRKLASLCLYEPDTRKKVIEIEKMIDVNV